MILKKNWQHEAACKSDPGGGDYSPGGGPEATARLNLFIENNCTICPVVQECLDSSIFTDSEGYSYDDAMYTVRGGYLPTGHNPNGRGRPPGSISETWKPKPPPAFIPAEFPRDFTILDRKVCKSGLHGILSMEDTVSAGGSRTWRTCRECSRIKDRNRRLKEKSAKMAA